MTKPRRSPQAPTQTSSRTTIHVEGSPQLGAVPLLFGTPRHAALACGVFFLAILIVFGDLIFGGSDRILSVSGTDTWSVFVGWCQFTQAEMAKGNYVPLWNPHLFSGAPCLGGFQEAFLYPTNYLLVFAIPPAINLTIIFHVFLAGLFTYLWMARRGLHPAAAILSGLIFMFGGAYYLHIAAGHIPNLRTMVWAPLVFLAIDDITTTRSFRGAWLGAGAVAMQIYAGHPQYVYITALLAGPYALLGLWKAPSKPRALLGLALMGIGGVALSAVQLFTGLAAAHESIRSGLREQVASTFPFPPENLLTMALPSVFGQISDHMYWGRWMLWEDCLFIGAVAVALACYGIARGERSQRPFVILAFLLVSLLIAFGKYTPLYHLLYRFLPGVNSFRGIGKVIFMSSLFLAYLAGVGLDRLLREKTILRLPAFFALIAAGILTIIGALIWHWGAGDANGTWAHLLYKISWFAEHYPHSVIDTDTFFRSSSHIVARDLFWCASICAALAVLWFLSRRDRRFVYAIAALAALELVVFAWQNRFTFPMAEIAASEKQLGDELDHAELPADARVYSGKPSVVLGIGRDEGWGNDPMVLRRYAEFMDINQDQPADEIVQNGFTRVSRTWGMARIFFPESVDGQKVWKTGKPYLFRGQLIEDVRIIPVPAKMLATIADRTFDARKTVLLESPVSPMPSSAPAGGPAGTVEFNDISTDEVEVTADVYRPCILLMTDTYSSAWQVIPIDNTPLQTYQIVPGDYAFRAISLVAGRHHFVLQYQPRPFVIGTWVTLISLVAWIGAGVMLMGWIKPKAINETTPGKRRVR